MQNSRLGGQLNAEDLADLTQDVFLILWRKLSEYTPATSFESWVYRICFLEMMNCLRKRRRRQRVLDEVAREAVEVEPGPMAARIGRFEGLHLGLECLEREEAAIIRLHHFEGRTFQEVGARLDIPVGTAKTRYYRGLTKLKEFLRHHEGGAFVEQPART